MKTKIRRWGLYYTLLQKRQLRSPAVYLLAGLCVFFLYVFQNVVFPVSYRLDYGICVDGADCAPDMLESLSKDGLYRYILYDSREAMMDEVRAGRIDCGFILDARLNAVTGLKRLNGLIDYVSSPSTAKGSILREKVFAAFLSCAAGQMLSAMTTDGKSFAEEGEDLTADMQATYRSLMENREAMSVIFETVDTAGSLGSSGSSADGNLGSFGSGTAGSLESSGNSTAASLESSGNKAAGSAAGTGDALVQKNTQSAGDSTAAVEFALSDVSLLDKFLGLCGTVIFAAAIIFARSRFLTECRSVTEAMRGTDRFVWPFLNVFTQVLPVSLPVLIAYLAGLGIYGSLTPAKALISVPAFMVYAFVCSLWAYLYSLLFRKEAMYLGFIVGIIILSLITCKPFFRIGMFVPPVEAMKWIFPVNYLLFL